MTYNTTAVVNLGRLAENYLNIKKAASPARVLCVVKADAYGHGAAECAARLHDEGADFFGVACLSEAISLRPYVGNSDILILGYTDPRDAGELTAHNVTQTVFSLPYAKALSANVPDGSRLRCHMKLDTGMNRIGFRALSDGGDGQLYDAVEAASLKGLAFTGAFTHFAQSDTPSSAMTATQFERFTRTLAALSARGIEFSTRHVSNSAAIFNYPEMKLDMVRAGIILYGFNPSPDTIVKCCRPIMTLKTTVSHLHTLYPGDTVSYGATFKCEREMRVATLTIGYADGFVRAYKGIDVYINGKPAPIVGRICMDQCMCNVTDIPEVHTGMEAVIFDDFHTADRLADAAGTINYEVTSILTPRVKRIYID